MKSIDPRLPPFLLLALTIALSTISSARGAALPKRIAVSSGDHDRVESIVTFSLPKDAPASLQLKDERGNLWPLQAGQGQGVFIVPRLAKRTTQVLELITQDAAPGAQGGVQATRDGTRLKISANGKPIFDYQAELSEPPRSDIPEIYKRGGYIHPVLSPSGLQVTDDYPANHIHHHGIWFPWTKTVFDGRQPDFWNMGQGKGRVEFVALDKSWSGPVHAGLIARHRFVDLTAPQPAVALKEVWEVRAYRTGQGPKPVWIFDLTSKQECASDKPLILPEYHYGGLGFRGNWAWNGKDQCFFLTSEGITDRVAGNQTRGRWCHVGGQVDGQWTGVAILCHPENFRAPQPMRLHPSEPFFCFAPSQLGQWEIKPGETYVSRYRFVVLDGPPDRAEIDRYWNDYAHPPEVAVK